MRIGIDVCLLGSQRTGMANYTRGLVSLLPEVAPQHEYFLYSNRGTGLQFSENTPVHHRVDVAFSWLPGSFWLSGRCATLLKRDNLDVYWSSGPLLPLGLPTRVRKIVTVHDLAWLRFPHTTTLYNLLVQKLCAKRAITTADQIVAVSRSTQHELIATFGVPTEKTRVVYAGVSLEHKPQDPAKAAEYISAKYDVPTKYLAAVSAVGPRKNFRVLIQALRILKSRGKLQCPLLIGGPIETKSSNLFREVEAADLTQNDIRFLGYLPIEDLPAFYGGAQVFLFPSLYEGFGIPPVEAMACGTPVIASNAQCMPEVLGQAAILESPGNAGGFADAIVTVLEDEKLRQSMRTAGYERVQQFRYEDSVKDLIAVLERSSSCGD